MKFRARFCSAALLFSAASFTAISCKKEEPAPAGGSTSGAPGAVKASDATASASSWGFVARLPKSTEGFAAFYRLSDVWNGFKNSNFVSRIMSNPVLARQMELDSLKAAWDRNDKWRETAALVEEIAGKEVVVVLAEGFTENAVRLAKVAGPIMSGAITSGMQNRIKAPAGGQDSVPEKSSFERFMESQTPAQMQAILTNLTDSEYPSLLLAVNAGGVRQKLDGLVKQALDSMPPDAQQVFEKSSFKADGKYEFQSLLFRAAKAVPPDAVEALKAEFSKMAGDPAKGAAFAEKVLAKTIELSWGWVDDHFVLALGKDHSHVKFAAAADSALSLPEVSSRAAAWQSKKAISLGYVSQKTIRALTGAFGGMTDTLISLVEMGAVKSPFPLDGVIADLRKLSTRAKALWPNEASAIIAASWWDGGLHSESFGGPRPRAFDASKPLTYGSFAGPATVFLSESRVNGAESDKSFAFFEEVCSTLYESYQKNIKPNLPAEMQGNIGMGEAMGIPMIKGLWKSVQDFRASLGSESAVLVNLDGAMPDLPQVPAEWKGAKIPRLLAVSDLRDRAKLAESWQGAGSVISAVIGIAKLPVKAEPTEMKSGDTTLWGWELPMNTGDFWPHTAVSGARWYLGTSPSLTREIAAKTPVPSGPASGAHVRINFNAVWDYAASLVPLAPNLPEQKKNMTGVLDLCRVLGEIDARCGEDKGESHDTLFLGIRDVK